MQLSITDETMRRIVAQAEQQHASPEIIAETALETIFGPTPSEIEQEIDSNHELKAMLEASEQDIRAGRIVSHEEVMEWHHNHPE